LIKFFANFTIQTSLPNQFFKIFFVIHRLFYKKNRCFSLFRVGFALFFALVAISCTDSGCIDADDFGEYESQTLEVTANSSEENCTFNYGKDLTDISHGSGIKTCLTSGVIRVADENDVEQESSHGCLDFETNNSAKFKNLCINYCVDLCNSNASGNSVSAEPSWTSTDAKVSGKNIGVTIKPGSQIAIRAIGNISVGESLEYPDIYVKANDAMPHSQKASWGNNAFFDTRKNQSIFVKFSGSWLENPSGTSQVGAGNTRPSGGANDRLIYNGAKRVVLYATPHPESYDFDVTAIDEKSGTRGVVLLPDPSAWVCSYSGGSLVESTCGNSPTGYTSNSYASANDGLSNLTYPVSSQFKTTILSRNGGMIRWLGDELLPDSYDPFLQSSVNCNGANGNCQNISNVDPNQGRIIGNLGAGSVEIVNNQASAFKVSFKSLVNDGGCNVILSSVSIANSSSNIIKTFNNVGITNTGWSNRHITLEPNHKIIISQNNQLHSGVTNCGTLIGAKFIKYHDIPITQSGVVSFTMLRGSGNCTINGRILNPTGSQFNFSGMEPDFYEYSPFYDSFSPYNPDFSDPMDSLLVSATPQTGSLVWSNKFFVRKGQTLRFSPESWNGTWQANNSSNRSCGIGMAMHIQPRPALLCRGQAIDIVDNPDCTPLYQGSTLIGCQEAEIDCANSGASNCPTSCQRAITCTTSGNVSNNFTRSGCSSAAIRNECRNAQIQITNPGAPFSEATCNSCASKMLINATKSAKIEVSGLNQCYDLEKYTGAVKNISASTTQTRSDVEDFLNNPVIAKGATLLGPFNGEYGNFTNFMPSPDTDTNGNVIYKLKSPVTFTQSSRVRFFMLDGDSFNDSGGVFTSYNNNSLPGTSYSGSNGFKINVSGTLEFSNGLWLQVRLCQETNSNSNICKNINPSIFPNQPKIVEITPPAPTSVPGASPILNANYRFNDYGNVIRTSPLGVSGDCTAGATGVENFSGATYYCHTHKYFNKTQLAAKTTAEKSAINDEIGRLRISFKILDPEVGNCTISSLNDGIKMKNPFYDGSLAVNTGAICAANQIPGNSTPSSPGTCGKEYYCANKYSNNSGKYFVNVRVTNKADGNISNIIGAVVNPIVEIMDGKRDNPDTQVNEATMGQAERVYRLLISDSRYQAILSISLITMFTFYGFGYLIGVVEMTHADIINRVIKIGLIYLFVGETGWEWFNKIVVKLFKDSTDYIAFMMASSFDESPELKNAIDSGNFYDKSVLFSSVDKVFGLFFASAVQKKVSALLFASIFGWAYLMIIYSSFMLYVFAVSNAVLLYLTAQVFISILFVLGPIFFVFTLFAQTKEMFDNWLKQLISFSLQQIFLLTTLAFFNMLMYEVIKMSLGYKICWDEVWTLNIITRITLLSFWTIASLPPRTNQHSEVGNIGNPEGIPSLFTILFIWVIASLMHKFISFMTDLAGGIAGGLKASALGSGVASFAKEMREGASKAVGKISSAVGLDAPLRKLDKTLFDSGKLAEEARGKKRKQFSMDQNNRNAMDKAGDRAVKDYKLNNAKEFMAMSQSEKEKALKGVREKGMNDEGKKLGLDDANIKRLKEFTGSGYVGSNMVAFALQSARQAVSSGGSLFTSMSDKKVNTTLSHSEGQKAMKSMTKDEREEFIKSVEDGKTKVKSSALNRIANNKIRTFGAVMTGGASEIFLRSKAKAKGKYKDFMLEGKAARELEKSGIISRNKAGFSRSDEDKQLIAERAKEMKAARFTEKDANYNAVAELRRESDYIEEKERISKADLSATEKIGAYFAAGAKRMLRADSLNTKAKGPVIDKIKNKLQGEKAKIQDERSDLLSDREEALNIYEATQRKVESGESYKRMKELNGRKDLSRGEEKELYRLKQEVKIQRNSQEAKEAASAVHQLDSQLKVLAKRDSEIDSHIDELNAPTTLEYIALKAKKWAKDLKGKKKDSE